MIYRTLFLLCQDPDKIIFDAESAHKSSAVWSVGKVSVRALNHRSKVENLSDYRVRCS